jgi:hypothetical protein
VTGDTYITNSLCTFRPRYTRNVASGPSRLVLKGGPYPCWATKAILPSWKGFQSRRGPYGAQDREQVSDGTVEVFLAPVKNGPDSPSEAEDAAVSWVIENEASISQALIASLFREYRSLQELYGYALKENTDLMPDIESADDLRSLIGLNAIYVHRAQWDGVPYSGFEFGCTWESEHGLGILMHGSRTVKIGWADTAFQRIAKDDHDQESGPLIVAPRKWPGWPPTFRKNGWTKTSGIPLYESTEEEFFQTAGAQFSIVGPLTSEAHVHEVFPESFPGKSDLIEFYLRYNGGSRTPQGCVMHCGNRAHRVSRDQLEKLNVEGFQSIPLAAEDRMIPFSNMLRHHAKMARIYSQIPEMKAFLEEHRTIAFDHSGNDLCISRQNGRVLFMDREKYKEGPIAVASSFREFVVKFWNIPYISIH